MKKLWNAVKSVFSKKKKSTEPKNKKKNNNKDIGKLVGKIVDSRESNKTGTFNFIAEFGVGTGGSVNISSLGVGVYQDKTYGISSQDGLYSNISGSGSVGIGIIGGSYEYTHEYPFKNESGPRHSSYDVQVISHCKSTEKSVTSKILMFYFNDDGTYFFGLDVDLHLIFGGHVKLGIEW